MTAPQTDGAGLERSVWPSEQVVHQVDSTIALTHFDDMDALSTGLVDYLVRCEREYRANTPKDSFGVGGTKIYHVDAWPVAGARLLDERAQAMFRETVGHPTSAVDLSWGNVYRAGDYIIPHAHRRSTGSVVYVLSLGDIDAADRLSGRFAIADSRLPLCNHDDNIQKFTPCMPPLKAGSMIVFPSSVVHFVTPYRGEDRPRITLSWNINAKPLAGRPQDDDASIPPHPEDTSPVEP